MNAYNKPLITSTLAILLSACGGSSDPTDSLPFFPPESVSISDVAGVFSGTYSTGGQLVVIDGIVSPNGELRVITQFDEQLGGQLTFNGENFTVDPLSSFISPGNLSDNYYAAIFNENGTASGTISNSEISGTTEFSNQTSNFSLTKEVELTNQGADFADVTGNYVTPDYLTSISFDVDGKVSGLDDEGCLYSGQLSIPEASINVYEVGLTVENCGEGNGTYDGLGTLVPSNYIDDGDSNVFIFQADNSQIAITAMLIDN